MRSMVWQLVQLSSAAFCSSVPGMLIIHSALVSWSARFLVGSSLRSTFAVCLGDHIGGGRRAQIVADGADDEGVMARLQAVLRKAVMALSRR